MLLYLIVNAVFKRDITETNSGIVSGPQFKMDHYGSHKWFQDVQRPI